MRCTKCGEWITFEEDNFMGKIPFHHCLEAHTNYGVEDCYKMITEEQ